MGSRHKHSRAVALRWFGAERSDSWLIINTEPLSKKGQWILQKREETGKYVKFATILTILKRGENLKKNVGLETKQGWCQLTTIVIKLKKKMLLSQNE